jgi:hypothetical protein
MRTPIRPASLTLHHFLYNTKGVKNEWIVNTPSKEKEPRLPYVSLGRRHIIAFVAWLLESEMKVIKPVDIIDMKHADRRGLLDRKSL